MYPGGGKVGYKAEGRGGEICAWKATGNLSGEVLGTRARKCRVHAEGSVEYMRGLLQKISRMSGRITRTASGNGEDHH